jgi:hypothetical protein
MLNYTNWCRGFCFKGIILLIKALIQKSKKFRINYYIYLKKAIY